MKTILAARGAEMICGYIVPTKRIAKTICGSVVATMMLSACAGTPIVTAAPSSCAALLPPEWKQGVAGAELPVGDTVADWAVFGDAQTGKLDQANGRTKDAIGIVERCEERDRKSIERASRGFLGRLFG